MIGSGAFGKVFRVIKARDGDYYAAKKFRMPFKGDNDGKKRKRDEEIWLDGIRNEVAIMQKNSHVSVTPSCHGCGLIH